LNCYAEGILTSNRHNNVYPITDMRYVKDGRTLHDRSVFAGIADRWIDGLRLQEQAIDLEHTRRYVKRLENTEFKEPTPVERPSWHK
jgi:hypothetical protein